MIKLNFINKKVIKNLTIFTDLSSTFHYTENMSSNFQNIENFVSELEMGVTYVSFGLNLKHKNTFFPKKEVFS